MLILELKSSLRRKTFHQRAGAFNIQFFSHNTKSSFVCSNNFFVCIYSYFDRAVLNSLLVLEEVGIRTTVLNILL